MPTKSILEDELPLTLSERRRQASRDLMRAEILTAAQHIIRTQGMEALSLRALAKAVGVTAPALYEYFPNKDAILRALFVQGAETMLARMDQLIASEDGDLARLLAILKEYRTFALEDPDFFHLLFGKVDPNLKLSESEYSGMHSLFERFIGVIANAVESGELRKLPPVTLSCSLWALIHGVAMLETDSFLVDKESRGDSDGRHFDAAVTLVLLSVATPRGAALIGSLDDVQTLGEWC